MPLCQRWGLRGPLAWSKILRSIILNLGRLMAYKQLTEFIALLEKHGHLKRISVEVSPELEITEIVDRVSKGPLDHNVALLFEKVTGSEFPVLINSLGHPQRMAWALGVESLEDLAPKLAALLDPQPPHGLGNTLSRANQLLGSLRAIGLAPNTVKKAPVQEVVHTGDQVDLTRLPVLKCWPADGGRYITLPTVITRDPVTHARNVGMYRLQVRDQCSLGMHWQLHKGGADHARAAAALGGQRIPVAVGLGGDPAVMWCGSAPLPPGSTSSCWPAGCAASRWSWCLASVSPSRCRPMPNSSIEGYVDPPEMAPEGPFGDHTGHYTPADDYPVLHVTAITHRARAHLPGYGCGHPADGRLLDGQGHRAAVPAADAACL